MQHLPTVERIAANGSVVNAERQDRQHAGGACRQLAAVLGQHSQRLAGTRVAAACGCVCVTKAERHRGKHT
jgi:limonene-1,2-epoxide hydrolase